MSPRKVSAGVLAGLCLPTIAIGIAGCRETVSHNSERSQPAKTPTLVLRDVAREAGVEFTLGHNGRTPLNILETIGHGGGFLDFNQDGFLDILLVGPSKVELWQGNGRTFRNVSSTVIGPRPGYWSGVAVGDYDNDGWPDVLLNGYGCRALLRNQNGRLIDAPKSDLTAGKTEWGTSAAFVDLDQDGRLDIFVCRYANFGPKSMQFCVEDGVKVMCAPRHYRPQLPRCFRNYGAGRFRDVTTEFGFDQTTGRGVGVVPADFNGDGRTDLYVANDTEPSDLFVQDAGAGKVHFTNMGLASGTALATNGRSLAGMGVDAQDYDGDGHLDLVNTTFEGEGKCLWRNNGEGQFEERGGAAGLDAMREWLGWGVGLEDFDNDGQRDLLYVNGHVVDRRSAATHRYAQPLRLFRGQAGSFSDVTADLPATVRQPIVGRGAAFGDYDNDGRVDVLISNLEGAALLLHNESPTGHWVGLQLEGVTSNRMGLGADISVEAGGRKWVAQAKTARSVYSASDARVLIGVGEVSAIQKVTVRWPSGRKSEHTDVKLDSYTKLREPDR